MDVSNRSSEARVVGERRARAGQLVIYSYLYTTVVCCFEALCRLADTILSTRRARSASGCGRDARLGSKELHARRRHVLMDDVGVARY